MVSWASFDRLLGGISMPIWQPQLIIDKSNVSV